VGRLIEVTHVSTGGQIDPQDWALRYMMDDEVSGHLSDSVFAADALVLGRQTFEVCRAAWGSMPSSPFVDRMNAMPKFVASRTLSSASWNATVIDGDVATFVADLKDDRDMKLVKFGNGPLDVTLMEHGLIDEIHILLAPVAVGRGRHMFEALPGAIPLTLAEARPLRSGVVLLVYTPPGR